MAALPDCRGAAGSVAGHRGPFGVPMGLGVLRRGRWGRGSFRVMGFPLCVSQWDEQGTGAVWEHLPFCCWGALSPVPRE